MDPVIALWVASLVGAAGFTAAGYFLARMKAPAPREVEAPAPSTSTSPSVSPPPPSSLPPPAPRKDPRVDEDDSPAVAEAARARAELEETMQKLAALREELRLEVVARHDAEKRATDLSSRLVSSSQQIAALRSKLGASDEAARRASMTPVAPRVSERPGGQRLATLAPGLFAEIEELRREVARLKAENDSLRVAAFTKR